MFFKKLLHREGSAESTGSSSKKKDEKKEADVCLNPSSDNLFDRVPRDVLAMILSMSLTGAKKQDVAPSARPPSVLSLGGASKRLAAEREAVRAVSKQVQSLALVSRCFARAVATDSVARRALQVADFHVPRMWYGGSLQQAFKAQWRLKLEQARHQALQDEAMSAPMPPPVACGMRAPPFFHAPPQAHPKETPTFAQFVGLNEEESARVRLRAKELLDFLRSFSYFGDSFKAEAAVARYRMFLKLRAEHPNLLLLPTADILFAELAHVFRTAEYHQDVKNGMVMARDPLHLSKGDEALYNEAAKGTSRLWQETFGEPYFAADQATEHEFFAHQAHRPSFDGGWREVPYQQPPPYIAAMGAAPKASLGSVPKVQLSAKDLIKDLKWMPELEQGFWKVSSGAPSKVTKTTEDFISHLFQCYQRFLFLCKTRPDLAHDLAPPVTVDLLWHAHQATPQLYLEETVRVVGFRLDHDPWPKGKGELRPLSEEFQCAWKTAFGTNVQNDHMFVSASADAAPDDDNGVPMFLD